MHLKSFKRDLRAEVGIGTMIVFIATILVAAIAAGVLISTSQKLQSKSQQTGSEAVQNVAGALTVVSVTGVRGNTTSGNIQQLDITVRLSAGADQLDLSKLVMTFDDGTNQINVKTCTTGGASAITANTEFSMDVLRGSVTDCGVMGAGDLVQLHLGYAAASGAHAIPSAGIPTSTHVTITYIPAHGTNAESAFTTPDGYGSNARISLI